MIIKEPNFIEYGSGGYSVIFRDAKSKIVYKLFKSYIHSNGEFSNYKNSADIVNNYLKKVFESEKKAYEITQLSPLLRKYTPKYLGTIIVDNVIDSKNNDISEQYLLGCCIKLGFVKGKNSPLEQYKILNKYNLFYEKILEVGTEFEKRKINYFSDSQIIYTDMSFRIVDFQTEDLIETLYHDLQKNKLMERK